MRTAKKVLLRSKLLFLLLSGAALVVVSTAQAAPVYKWQDESGTIHYSTKPHEGARKAKLPKITRGEVKLTSKKLFSCKSHGGIDCQAGADTDGSVICYDGFPDASARYKFSCASPKLEITEVSDVAADSSFSVFVRNSRSVAAHSPSVVYTQQNGQKITLTGPGEVEAFGLAEFTFDPDSSTFTPKEKVALAQLNLTCANCP